MTSTFFEGTEKKLELVVDGSHGSLRELGQDYWEAVVRSAGALVLSTVATAEFEAYLLSESSLFVFDDHITMITCGRTRLADAIERLVSAIGPERIAFLVYERKNEHFPHAQDSSFYDDARRIAALVPGAALRFGDQEGHRIEMFHSTRPYEPDSVDVTVEVLMHGVARERAEAFRSLSPDAGPGDIARRFGFDALIHGLDDLIIDEHAFQPAGYSMNAVSGSSYVTLHVTPEEVGSYVSFETNHDVRSDLDGVIHRVIRGFEPESFDVFVFAPQGSYELSPDGYVLRKHVVEHLCGYDVSYHHFFAPPRGPIPAFPIALTPGESS